MELKRVVVTGLGAITPLGKTAPETWENIKLGKSGAGPITHFDASKFKTQFACEVKGYNATDYFDRKEVRKMDLYEQYAVVAADEAIKDAGLDGDDIDKNNVGVIFGVGIGGIHTFEEEAGNYAKTGETMGPRYNPFFIPKMIADIASGQVSINHGFRGPNYTTTSACASSTNALADAFNLVRLGKASAIVAGGAEAASTQCTRCRPATMTPNTLHARSAPRATDSSWAKARECSSSKSSNTRSNAEHTSTAK